MGFHHIHSTLMLDPSPLDVPGGQVVTVMHSFGGPPTLPALAEAHSSVLNSRPSAASLLSPASSKTTSSRTQMFPLMSKVLFFLAFLADSDAASLQAQQLS